MPFAALGNGEAMGRWHRNRGICNRGARPMGSAALLCVLFASLGGSARGQGVEYLSKSFAVVSDWGGTNLDPWTTPGERAVATVLNEAIHMDSVAFVLSAGNNFMPMGMPASATDPNTELRFTETWQDTFTPEVPWYVIGGYMDWFGNITAERVLSNTTDKWNYPDLYHTFTVKCSDGGETLQVIMVDTVSLVGATTTNPGIQNIPAEAISEANITWVEPPPATSVPPASPASAQAPQAAQGSSAATGRRSLREDRGRVAGRAAAGGGAAGAGAGSRRRESRRRSLLDFNQNTPPPIDEAQWGWITDTITVSTADWIIVVGNDPVWSVGDHGPTWGLVNQLLPIMDAHGVALYISGRDAIAQHIIPSTEYPNVDFVGTGNGAYCDQHQAQVLPSQNLCPPGSARFVSGDNTGFVSVTHSGEASNGTSQLTVNFHDSLGNLLYAFTKGNPRHMRATTTPPKTLTSWSTLADENAGTTATGVTKPLQMLALATIFMLLCLGYLRFRADMDGPLDSATRQTVARVLKEKDIAWVKTSAPAEGDSVVRGGAASNAERRPLLPKSALPTTDL